LATTGLGIINQVGSCPCLYLRAAPSSQSPQDIGSVRVRRIIVLTIYKGLGKNRPQKNPFRLAKWVLAFFEGF
jgi:hypothetical protein